MASRTPKWREIAETFAQKIRDREYLPGDQLPQIRELVSQGLGSKTTIMAAYRSLETEGLVVTARGHGTRVRRQYPRQVRRHQTRYGWEKALALKPEVERRGNGVVEQDTGLAHEQVECHAEFNTVPADDRLAQRFGVPPGTLMLHRQYWHSVPGDPIALSLIDSYLVHEVASRNPDLLDSSLEPWPGGTHHQLSTIGIEIDQIQDDISTRLATLHESQHLGIPNGSPVILLDKTSVSTDAEVVEFSHVVLPGERTEISYTVPLERWPGR
ncbi:GntR family transcriptional regulator [Kitasatospora sp. NPDC057692]|uniref:GntR family transcriptional regulator n=1 Tax=Kitasatospora sp. NPDC057692 TaxID=3346215 RepID=UPI0036C5EC54